MLSPDAVDVSALAPIHAALDWLDIKLTFATPTQARHVRDALHRLGCKDASFVTPCDPLTRQPLEPEFRTGSRATTTVFVVRIQNPTTPAGVRHFMEQLNGQHPFAAEPECDGMEVTIWLRHSNRPEDERRHRADLASLAERVYRNLAHPVSDNHRHLPKLNQRGAPAPGDRVLTRDRLAKGLPIFIGNRDDNQVQRIYVATDDRMSSRTKQRRALHPAQWAVKFEAALRGPAMPFKTLQQWAGFKFESLARPYFALRKPKPGVGHPEIACFQKLPPEAATRRKYSPLTEADTATSDAIRVALRNLTARQRAGWSVP